MGWTADRDRGEGGHGKHAQGSRIGATLSTCGTDSGRVRPRGGYFGTKKANEPVHISYDYATKKIFVVNSTLTAKNGLTATISVNSVPDLPVKYTTSVPVNIAANSPPT